MSLASINEVHDQADGLLERDYFDETGALLARTTRQDDGSFQTVDADGNPFQLVDANGQPLAATDPTIGTAAGW